MRNKYLGLTLFAFAVMGSATIAQDRAPIATGSSRGQAVEFVQVAQKTGDKATDKDKKAAPPAVDFSELPATSAEAPTGLNPHMIGDFPGFAALVTVPVPSFAQIRVRQQGPGGVPITRLISVPTVVNRQIRVPFGGRGGFKIGENEGVLPGDRASFTYNYYDDQGGPARGSDRPQIIMQNVMFQGKSFPARVLVPGVPSPRLDVHRSTLSFEKSFLDGDFSFGVRVPTFQQNGAQGFEDQDLGDMTFLMKYAPYVDRDTGSGISVGLAITAPTGPSIPLPDGDLDSTLWQPFVGYQFNRARLLFYGFSALVIPSDNRDLMLLFNDVGLGFRMYEGEGLLRSITPALEAHVTTPLDHRGPNELVQGIDLVVLTGGVHLGLGQRSLLTLGVAAPVTGPRLFDVEAVVQFNFRF